MEAQQNINELTYLEQRIDSIQNDFESPSAWEDVKNFIFSQTKTNNKNPSVLQTQKAQL